MINGETDTAGVRDSGRWPALVTALAVTLSLTMLTIFGAAAAGAADTDAGTSVINGHSVTISQYPWQVGLLATGEAAEGSDGSRFQRQYCGGALVTPTMVVTAAHCVMDGPIPRDVGVISVLSGVGDLAIEPVGAETPVKAIHLPLNGDGDPIYTWTPGWDFAVVELSAPAPAPAQTIKLAGPGEQDLLKPGTPLTVTGWGATFFRVQGTTVTTRYPTILQAGDRNVQPTGTCLKFNNRVNPFTAATDLCTGDAKIKVDSCVGDSGGPIIATRASQPRLVGVVSRGSEHFMCQGEGPAIDTAVGKSVPRDWIRNLVMTKTGIDPVGSGATQPALPKLARVPAVKGKTLKKARKLLKKAGFRNIRVKRTIKRIPRKRKPKPAKVTADYLIPGWLTSPSVRFVLKVKVQKRRKR